MKTKAGATGSGPVFSRLVEVEHIPDKGLDISITANEAECAAIAKADDLPAVLSFAVDFHIARRGATWFNVSGTLRAKVTQICVLSLDPFDSEITEKIDIDFAPLEESEAEHARALAELNAAQDKAAVLLAQADPPDPIINGRIDLGGLTMELLALALDPYPKKPGVAFAEPAQKDGSDEASPFAVLEKLKNKS
jgi:uncharacterized metal-binding protein YceD (DUF177 family)